jgi:hypothetical protein
MATALNACSVPSAVIRSQAVSYDDAIEDTTNKLLVLNILRAKDKAPQHFDEIPSIHESIQATASLSATYPFGPRPATSPGRNTFTPGLNIQMSPSFEVDHLDTQDVVTGLASPIDPKFVKYWLDRGLDRRIVLLLFFSAVDISGTNKHGESKTIRITNSPREAIDTLTASNGLSRSKECLLQSDFQHYLRFINTLTTFSAHSYVEYRLLAEGLTLAPAGADAKSGSAIKDLSDLAGMDSTKYQWFRDATKNTYSIYAISSEPKTALCDGGYKVATGSATLAQKDQKDDCPTSTRRTRSDDQDPMADAASSDTVLFQKVDKTSQDAENFCEVFDQVVTAKENFLAAVEKGEPGNVSAPKATKGLRFEMRSVGEIIQFLGDLLEFQETLEENHKTHPTEAQSVNRTLTFGYCPEESDRPGCGDIFFNLRHDTCNVRFSLSYRGQKYAVPNYDTPRNVTCPSDEAPGTAAPQRNHTLEVLAVVNQLIDLQKSAKDIRETPYIQVLP